MEDTSDLAVLDVTEGPFLEPEVVMVKVRRSRQGNLPPLPPEDGGDPRQPREPRWGMIAVLLGVAVGAWLAAMRELA